MVTFSVLHQKRGVFKHLRLNFFNNQATGSVTYCISTDQNPVFRQLNQMRDFKMDVIKWQMNFVSCNFCLESVPSFDFEITPMISD